MRKIVLTGQVYGMVDAVYHDEGSILVFIHENQDKTRQVRCVVRGPMVEELLRTSPPTAKHTTIVASGRLSARCVTVNGELTTELVCYAGDVEIEPAPKAHRVGGAIHANLKGIIQHWNPSKSMMLRTYLNGSKPGEPKRVDCILQMEPWLKSLSEVGSQRLMERMDQGREYTCQVSLEVSYFTLDPNGAKTHVPVMRMLPRVFRLQA